MSDLDSTAPLEGPATGPSPESTATWVRPGLPEIRPEGGPTEDPTIQSYRIESGTTALSEASTETDLNAESPARSPAIS